jgi:hypothetical protein
MAVTVGKKPKAAAKKAKALTFTIDCSKPVDDKIMEISSFEKFLEQKIKVGLGKAGTDTTEDEEHCCSQNVFTEFRAASPTDRRK